MHQATKLRRAKAHVRMQGQVDKPGMEQGRQTFHRRRQRHGILRTLRGISQLMNVFKRRGGRFFTYRVTS